MWGKKQGSGGRFRAKVALKSMVAVKVKIPLETKGCTTLVTEPAQCGRLLVLGADEFPRRDLSVGRSSELRHATSLRHFGFGSLHDGLTSARGRKMIYSNRD